LVVDDPHSSLASTDTTVTDSFGPFESSPFESSSFGSFHSTVASTIEPDELIEEVSLAGGNLDVVIGQTVATEEAVADVGRVAGGPDVLGWIAPTDADLLLEEDEDEADPVVALSLTVSTPVDTEPAADVLARPEDHEGLEDHVRMYLREIGLVPLLSWDGEKRLARRMEEGIYLDRLFREVQEQDAEAGALDLIAELERRFARRFGLIEHWAPISEHTQQAYRQAMSRLAETAEIPVESCQDMATTSGQEAEAYGKS